MDINRISGYISGKLVFFLMQVRFHKKEGVGHIRKCTSDLTGCYALFVTYRKSQHIIARTFISALKSLAIK